MDKICPDCKGKKTMWYEWSNGIAVKCQTCKGTGRIPLDKIREEFYIDYNTAVKLKEDHYYINGCVQGSTNFELEIYKLGRISRDEEIKKLQYMHSETCVLLVNQKEEIKKLRDTLERIVKEQYADIIEETKISNMAYLAEEALKESE